jgi:hypothetical protein
MYGEPYQPVLYDSAYTNDRASRIEDGFLPFEILGSTCPCGQSSHADEIGETEYTVESCADCRSAGTVGIFGTHRVFRGK